MGGLFRKIKLHFAINKEIAKLPHAKKQDLVLKWQLEHSAKKTNLQYPEWLREHIASTIHKK